jgi:hypothetical protein
MTDKFERARHTSAALAPLTRVIGSDLPYWRTRHINITRWGATDASGKMVIHLKNYTPAAAAELCAHYGNDRISVSTVEVNTDGFRLCSHTP